MCCNLFKIDVQWPQDVSTSPWLPQWIYVLLVGLVTTLFLAFQIVHLMDFFPKFGWFYFIFLTNWTLVLESLTLLLLWVSTIWAYGSAPGEGQKAPLFVRYTLSLWYIIQPMSLVVVILYWTVVNQFWDPYAIEFSSLWAHLLNWMVLMVHLFVSNLPWSFKNGIWAGMFSVVYVIWTIIHYFLEIGKGIPCDDYEIEKCPIYSTFDWNKPGQTIGICVGASVALLVVLGLYTGFFRCRDACSGRGRTSTGEKDVEAAAAS